MGKDVLRIIGDSLIPQTFVKYLLLASIYLRIKG
jgi:hypothetical protein